jgi:hypothetical protein
VSHHSPFCSTGRGGRSAQHLTIRSVSERDRCDSLLGHAYVPPLFGQVPLTKQYFHAIQDTGSSQSQSAELAPCPERKRRVAAPKHPERMRADNQPADTKQGTRAETSARCRNTALRKSMAKGQLTRICRHTGRPGKASNPKNTGRKTQSAANYPQFLFRLESTPIACFQQLTTGFN